MAINILSRQFLVNNSDSSANFGIVESFRFILALSCRLLCKPRLADGLSSRSQSNFLVFGREGRGKDRYWSACSSITFRLASN